MQNSTTPTRSERVDQQQDLMLAVLTSVQLSGLKSGSYFETPMGEFYVVQTSLYDKREVIVVRCTDEDGEPMMDGETLKFNV